MARDVARLTSPGDGVKMHPVALTFDDAQVEREFRRVHDSGSLATVRLAALVGAALYLLFGILDAQLVPAEADEMLLVRIACAVVALLAAAATYRPWFPRLQHVVVCSTAVLFGWGLSVMQLIAPVPDAWAAMGTMLVLIFVFAVLRLRVLAAAVTAVLILAAYEVTLLASDVDGAVFAFLNFELIGFVVAGLFACHTLERLHRRDFLGRREIEAERRRSDVLLHNVLPETIARRLREDPGAIADAADGVSVLFADIVGFTPLTVSTPPQALVAYLDRLFGEFDALCDRFGAEKIKTIGDGYMAVVGVPDPHPDPGRGIAELALAIRKAAADLRVDGVGPLSVRVGICSGSVLAGVIGRRRFHYDLWGDTVNTASRLEHHGRPGAIHVCAVTRALLGERYVLDGPEVADLKGKGPTERWELAGPRPAGGTDA